MIGQQANLFPYNPGFYLPLLFFIAPSTSSLLIAGTFPKKVLFMGGEFAQGLEWRYDYGLEWQLLEREQHKKTQNIYSLLLVHII